MKTSLSQYSILQSLFSISHTGLLSPIPIPLRPEIGRSDTTPNSLHPACPQIPGLLSLRFPVFAYARSEIHA